MVIPEFRATQEAEFQVLAATLAVQGQMAHPAIAVFQASPVILVLVLVVTLVAVSAGTQAIVEFLDTQEFQAIREVVLVVSLVILVLEYQDFLVILVAELADFLASLAIPELAAIQEVEFLDTVVIQGLELLDSVDFQVFLDSQDLVAVL